MQETVTPVSRAELLPLRPVLQQLGGNFVIALLTSLLVVQATTNAVTPLLSLLVGDLAPQASTQTIVWMTGVVAAAPGIATILMANRVGRILDRLGANRCLLIF
ncbi:hypothetical protein [Lactiplantibacillus paraplantarum]|uniref:hypothetical protein n=1 Tax=Lactiplantibacillus paraplantarum TaxID=60520 RepID=UPI001CDAFFC8|nr:hypothetical protein [Lactiplantibacillus paraplantarum]